jgi:hypothetical protein
MSSVTWWNRSVDRDPRELVPVGSDSDEKKFEIFPAQFATLRPLEPS